MTGPECAICSTQHERAPQAVYANAHWRASLSANQAYVGTLFVELLVHKPALSNLSSDEWTSFMQLVRMIEAAERQAFGATLCNWSCLLDNFYQAPSPVPHVFWHVRPRFNHHLQLAGRTLADPNFGHPFEAVHLVHVTPKLKRTIAQKLRAALSGAASDAPIN